MRNVHSITPWIISTFRELSEKPENWPTEKETPIQGCPYWACLRISEAPYIGDDQWTFEAVAYEGRNAQIEMSMCMEKGNMQDILLFINKELQKGCPKPWSYINDICEKLDYMDDDYHRDW